MGAVFLFASLSPLPRSGFLHFLHPLAKTLQKGTKAAPDAKTQV